MGTGRRADDRDEIRAEIEEAREEFRRVRRSLSEQDWRARSLNAGWTNGEIMFHAMLGFIIVSRLAPVVRFWARLPAGFSFVFAGVLNFLTPVFNVVNAIGAGGVRGSTPASASAGGTTARWRPSRSCSTGSRTMNGVRACTSRRGGMGCSPSS